MDSALGSCVFSEARSLQFYSSHWWFIVAVISTLSSVL